MYIVKFFCINENESICRQGIIQYGLVIGYIMMVILDKIFIVVVIDFGMIFSGYVYFLISDYKKDFLKIYFLIWENDGNGIQKILIFILFDDKGEFYSFGYEVEKKYLDLVVVDELDEDEDNELDEDYWNWFYFRWFKMVLFRVVL